MGRIRTFAALLAMLSAAGAMVLAQQGLHAVAIMLIAGAGILALIAPFPAPEPSKRLIVALACLGYVITTTGAFVLASANGASTMMTTLIAIEAVAGGALCAQAYRTRNRRQRPTGLRAYYLE